MESSEVAEFRSCILDADWSTANAILMRLGIADDDSLYVNMTFSQPRWLRMLTVCSLGGQVLN